MESSLGITPADIFRLSQIACALAEKCACSVSDAIDQIETGKGDLMPQPDPVNFARTSKRFRLNRERKLGAPLFRDPAWDMLLDLLISDAEDRRVSISSLCHGAGVPLTTALRHLDRLEQYGFVIRHDDDRDQRRSFVELAHDRKDELLQFLGEWNRDLLLSSNERSGNAGASLALSQRRTGSDPLHPVFLS